MKAEERRKQLLKILSGSTIPLSASALATRLNVSRQIIVGDVALLRASGVDIIATPRGYVLGVTTEGRIYTLACIHDDENMRNELYILVDNGCEVLDVVVEHAVYGQITGMLKLGSRYDVDQFIDKLKEANAAPISTLTNGVHLHHIACPSAAIYDRVVEMLRKENILVEE